MQALAEVPAEERARALSRFHLLEPYLAQIERILEINNLDEVTLAVVQAARESLVIGQA